MTLRDILNKIRNIIPFIAFPIALQSNIMAREASKAKEAFLNATNETKKLMEEIKVKQDILINNTQVKNKISTLTNDASTEVNNLTTNNNTIKAIMERLNDPNISEKEREFILGTLEKNSEQGFESLEKINKALQKIIDEINKSGDNYISQLNVLIEKYKEFLSTLNVEQLDIVVNTLGYIIILSYLFSIAAILYGDFLITYFNLEEKFPKIASFIKIRRKFQ
jgi:hypothetical protein